MVKYIVVMVKKGVTCGALCAASLTDVIKQLIIWLMVYDRTCCYVLLLYKIDL
jgi:hypothetical protein